MDYSMQTSTPPTAPPAYLVQQQLFIGVPASAAAEEAPAHAHGGAWSTGVCDCRSNVSNCCMTCWCPCVTFGQIAETVDRGSTSCGASCALYCLIAFTGCSCFYSYFYRQKMRKQYMLPEKPCGDCLLHFCCESCALCQEYRELQNRGCDMSLGWHVNVDRQGQGGVNMAPVVQGGMSR